MHADKGYYKHSFRIPDAVLYLFFLLDGTKKTKNRYHTGLLEMHETASKL